MPSPSISDRFEKRKLETYARTLLEAAKSENRVLENIEPLKADANASPEVLSVLSQMAVNGDLDKLGAVLDLYSEMAEGDEATVGVTVTTAVPLDNELRMLVTQKCELDLGRNVSRMALNANNEIIAFEFMNLGKFTDALKAGKTPEEAIAGAMGHYGQWENAAKYIDPRTDEETHTVANVFPVHE